MEQVSGSRPKGTELVWPFLHFSDTSYSDLNGDKSELLQGINILQSIKPTFDFWELDWILGKAFEAAGDSQRSYLYFEKAIRIVPYSPDVVLEYVIAALRVGMHAQATQAAMRSVNKCPRDPTLLYAAALACFASGDTQQSILFLESLDAIKPNDKRAGELRSRMT
jgi:tetratricopeptide (TPR) repeat protein